MSLIVDVDIHGQKNVLVNRWTTHAELARVFDEHADVDMVRTEALTDLEPLRGQPITALSLTVRCPADVTPLLTLAPTLGWLNLQFQDGEPVVDLSAFTRLTSLRAAYSVVASSLTQLSELKKVYLTGYTEASLTTFADLRSLERLGVQGAAALIDLRGLEDTRLIALTVERAPALADLSGLARTLEELYLRECQAVDRLDPLTSCPHLQTVNVGVCGTVESLHPLAELRNLSSVGVWETRIGDDDLSPLLELPQLKYVQVGAGKDWVSSVDQIAARVRQTGGHG